MNRFRFTHVHTQTQRGSHSGLAVDAELGPPPRAPPPPGPLYYSAAESAPLLVSYTIPVNSDV